MRGKQLSSNEIVNEIVRIITESPDKCLYGTTWEIAGTLRDRGALRTLDRGIKRHGRRDRTEVRQSKFSLLSAALNQAVAEERVIFVKYDDGVAYEVPRHVPPVAVSTPVEASNVVSINEDTPKLTHISGALRVNLHYKWGWPEMVA